MGDECGFGCLVGLAVRGGGEQSMAGWFLFVWRMWR